MNLDLINFPKQAIYSRWDSDSSLTFAKREKKNGEKQKRLGQSNYLPTCLLFMNQKPTKLKEEFN